VEIFDESLVLLAWMFAVTITKNLRRRRVLQSRAVEGAKQSVMFWQEIQFATRQSARAPQIDEYLNCFAETVALVSGKQL
jgi:hypothetical protein